MSQIKQPKIGPDYEPASIEHISQQYWQDSRAFEVTEDPDKEKILLFVDVSLSQWQITHGSCSQLHDW